MPGEEMALQGTLPLIMLLVLFPRTLNQRVPHFSRSAMKGLPASMSWSRSRTVSTWVPCGCGDGRTLPQGSARLCMTRREIRTAAHRSPILDLVSSIRTAGLRRQESTAYPISVPASPRVNGTLSGILHCPRETRRSAFIRARCLTAPKPARTSTARPFIPTVTLDDITRLPRRFVSSPAQCSIGVLSRVDVQPMWVRLYFRERPNGDFVVCFPRKLFEGFGGPNFSGLIGKAVDVRGGVTRPVCSPGTAGMQIGVPSQIKIY